MKTLWIGVVVACTLLVGLPGAAGARTAPAITLLNGVNAGSAPDVYVDGVLIHEDLEPSTFLDLSGYAGRTVTLELRRPERRVGGGPRVVTLPATGNWTIVEFVTFFSPNGFTYLLGLATFENPVTPVGRGNGVFVVRNTRQGTGTIAVAAGDDLLMSGIGQGQQSSLVLPAGTLSTLRFIDQNGNELPVPVTSVDIVPGTTLILYLDGLTQRVAHATLPSTGPRSAGRQALVGTSLVVSGLALLAASRRRVVPR